MCGIVGYIGNKKAENILLDGLTKLEYRGYDSAGLTIMEKENFKTIKNKGRVKALAEITEQENLQGTIGIAHTRWATHGKPSSVNSHPHNDNTNTFSVVHNGIIENYEEIRKFLTQKRLSIFIPNRYRSHSQFNSVLFFTRKRKDKRKFFKSSS